MTKEIDLTEVLTDVRHVINRLKSKSAELNWIRNALVAEGIETSHDGYRENSTYEMLKLFLNGLEKTPTRDELLAQLTEETKEKLFQEVFVEFADWKTKTRGKPPVPRHWYENNLELPESGTYFYDRDDELWYSHEKGFILAEVKDDGDEEDYLAWSQIRVHAPFIEKV